MHCFSVCVGWYVGPTHASVSDTGRNGWGVEIYLHPAHYFDEVKVFGASNWVQLNIRSRFYFDSIRVCECECVWGVCARARAYVRACVCCASFGRVLWLPSSQQFTCVLLVARSHAQMTKYRCRSICIKSASNCAFRPDATQQYVRCVWMHTTANACVSVFITQQSASKYWHSIAFEIPELAAVHLKYVGGKWANKSYSS